MHGVHRFIERSQLPSENIKLRVHSYSRDSSVEQFSTKSHEISNKKAVEFLGWGVPEISLTPAHYGGVMIKADVPTRGRNDRDKTHKSLKKLLYSSIVKHLSSKLANITFDFSDLYLSTEAEKELIKRVKGNYFNIWAR